MPLGRTQFSDASYLIRREQEAVLVPQLDDVGRCSVASVGLGRIITVEPTVGTDGIA